MSSQKVIIWTIATCIERFVTVNLPMPQEHRNEDFISDNITGNGKGTDQTTEDRQGFTLVAS
jgi:hypothetical protein